MARLGASPRSCTVKGLKTLLNLVALNLVTTLRSRIRAEVRHGMIWGCR